MAVREQDDLPYRSVVTSRDQPSPVSSTNEANYDTLRIVRDMLATEIEALYKDFNAFDVLRGETKARASTNLLRQIEAKQLAFEILSPVLEAVDSAVNSIDDKYKQR